MSRFKITSKLKPAGDQPKAIASLIRGLQEGMRFQTLLGVTGSGKTFTIGNVIEAVKMPTLVIAHNKTLAAQLVQEYRDFFPDNAVHYFVSYYDYYQPEAYLPITDTYIEKEAQINEEIDRLRHASTQALLTRRDVIVVASVSCIYGLGSPVEYERENLRLEEGMTFSRGDLLGRLVALHYERTNADLKLGTFRAIGQVVEIMPVNERLIYRFSLEGNRVGLIETVDPITRRIGSRINTFFIFPAKHFVTPSDQLDRATASIEEELRERLRELEAEGKILEVERLKRRTNYDLALIREIGYCNGIENYSRHFSGRLSGEPPETLLSYFPHTSDGQPAFLTVIDESHVTVPQIAGMYGGDASRKKTLIEHGFRLPSACDNRPLKFHEFDKRVGQVIFTSATPASFEGRVSSQIVEQVIRPTGLVDPEVVVRPITSRDSYQGQVGDFMEEAAKVIGRGERVLATTLTKKMAEDLSDYLKERHFKAAYLHSDIDTLERIEILSDFRRGKYDCLVGVNLLREGLDLPEVSFIAILDADKEGFLRSETSLIQTIGRAARNVFGRVILYADKITGSMDRAVSETKRRRKLQLEFNRKHHITPTTIVKKVHDITETLERKEKRAVETLLTIDRSLLEEKGGDLIREKEKQMNEAVKLLDFETAAILRDEIRELKKYLSSSRPHRKVRNA